MGDAAYGDGATRQTFADAGRKLVARVPGRPDRKHFPKDDFVIDLAAGSCTCPAGQVTHTIVPAGKRTDAAGRVHRLQAFQFDGAECRTCPLRSQCIAAKGRKGRRVLIHPQEGLLQEARALQQSAAYDEYRARRVVVEHRLARLVQLGIRQSRYFGRVKTRFQLYLAATVANLTLVAGKIELSDSVGGGKPTGAGPQCQSSVPSSGGSSGMSSTPHAVAATAWLGQIRTLTLLVSALLVPDSCSPIRGLRAEILAFLRQGGRAFRGIRFLVILMVEGGYTGWQGAGVRAIALKGPFYHRVLCERGNPERQWLRFLPAQERRISP